MERLKILRKLEKMGRLFIVNENNWSFYLDLDHNLMIYSDHNCIEKFGSYYFDTREQVEDAISNIGESNIKKYLFGMEEH